MITFCNIFVNFGGKERFRGGLLYHTFFVPEPFFHKYPEIFI